MKLSWKDVFDCSKIFPMLLFDCFNFVSKTGYRYMCFNGRIFDVKNPSPIENLGWASEIIE